MNIEKVKEKIKGAITNIRKLDKDYIVIGIIIIAVIIFIVLNIGKVTEFNKEEKENTTINASIEESKNDIEEKENKENKEETKEMGTGIFVHIDGWIQNPGVYEIKENDRVNTIIEKAGGLKEGASIKSINLAARLSDGDKIYIPNREEEKQIETTEVKGNNTGTVKITKNSKININKASISELKQITGIGESTANKIIDYRENVGKFKKIEDIKEVKGIGDSKYESIKDKITI
jgi:competence protein comEA helix-hairpin-helix repeat region